MGYVGNVGGEGFRTCELHLYGRDNALHSALGEAEGAWVVGGFSWGAGHSGGLAGRTGMICKAPSAGWQGSAWWGGGVHGIQCEAQLCFSTCTC